MDQEERLAQGLLNTRERCELLGRERPEFCLRGVGLTLLTTERRVSEKCYFNDLKRHCKLNIKMDKALEVAYPAQVVLQNP